jgi:hypothetical protein
MSVERPSGSGLPQDDYIDLVDAIEPQDEEARS